MSELTSVNDAWRAIEAAVPRWPVETVRVEHASGRILAEAVAADRDQPPFDRVTMDGIAIASTALAAGMTRFDIAGVQAAGAPASRLDSPGQCFEVMTGAVLPTGADTVVPVEVIETVDGSASLTAPQNINPGQFVHRQGTDYAAGDALLAPGNPLAAPEVAVLASVGQGHVRVGGVPRVAVVSTGDELVAAEDPVLPHQIRRANDYAIAAALRQRGVGTPAAVHLRDEPDAMRTAVAELLDTSDVLVLSGGVSKGRFDYLPSILDELGVVKAFHRVRQRPGKPMWFGTLREKLVFALPGNPVSALVCLHRYVLPALALGAGGAPRGQQAVLGADLAFRGDLTRFVPVIVTPDAGGAPVAVPRELNTSGDFFGLAGTQGFVELDGQQAHWHAGTAVPFHPW